MTSLLRTANPSPPTGSGGSAASTGNDPASEQAAVSNPTAVSAGTEEQSRARRVQTSDPDAQTVNGLTQQELKLVRELSARDREVRAHEQAHANVGGQYAGAPRYTLQRGPDGRQYAVGGSVSIDTSPIPGDPEATIRKAQIVRRAALAPAQPSPQDRAVASEATSIAQQARAELLRQEADQIDQEAQSLARGSENQDTPGFNAIA